MSIGEIKADDLLGLVGRELGGRYRLDQFIDRGGFGAVYRGLDKRLNQPVAVKVGLSNREFMREARLAAEVRHDNIVHVTDFGDDGGLAYLVMEFLEGENLEVLFKSQGNQLSLEQLRKLVRQVGAALAHAHGEQLIHRDLKPRNIILKRSTSKSGTSLAAGKFVLLDFGIAAKLDATGTQRNRTRDGAGTVEYMAPELLTSSPRTTPQSDIYGFGTILYQMMTGRVPFPQKDNSHLALATCLHAIATEPPPSFSAVAPHRVYSAELQALVMQCLEKDPVKRPQSVIDLVEQFRAVCPATASATALPFLDDDEEDDAISRPGLPPEPAEPGIFDHWTWLVTAAACAVILAIAFWPPSVLPPPPAPPTPVAELTAKVGDDVVDLAKAPLSLLPGDVARVTFRFDNLPPDAAPLFEAPEVPQGVKIESEQGVGNAETQTYTISVPDPNVTLPAEAAITFRGRTASGAEPLEIVTHLELRPPVPWLPESLKSLGFSLAKPPQLCRIDKEFFPTVLNRDVAGEKVRFRLVPERTVAQRRIRTFYVMEGLVTNRMFAAYAQSRPDRPWKPARPKERTSETEDDFPVTDIVPLDGHDFAQWIGGKSATLPTTTEWDVSSGYYEFLEALERVTNLTSREIPSGTFEAFRKKPVPIANLNYTVLYGMGPDANEVYVPDGGRLTESSPFGCRYPRSGSGTPITELTASLQQGPIITEMQRVIEQTSVSGFYNVFVRGVGEGPIGQGPTRDQHFQWAVRDGETVRIVPTEQFDQQDRALLSGNTSTSGPNYGFRVVLHTLDAAP